MIVFAVIIAAMKFLIASDIHGSAEAAGKIAELYRNGSYDKLLLLGDLLYHGPRNDLPSGYDPKRTIAILSELRNEIIAVRGNCEAEVDQMVLPFPVLSESAVVFADDKTIFLTHGHIWNEERHPEGIDVFLSGHTHIPVIRERDGILFFNPGSVSIPKGGSDASYGEWIDGSLRILSLRSRQMMMEAGTQA